MVEEFIDDIIADVEPANSEAEKPVEDNASEEVVEPAVTDTPEKEAEAVETPTEENQTIEELATQLGWKHDHDGENFVDASTYILRSREIQDSMRDHNKDLKSQLSNLQGSVDALKEHNERVYKAELTRMQGEIERLRKERREAIETADVDKVDALDKEITGLEENLNQPAPKSGPSTNPIYDDWVKDNEWYLTNNEMAAYADTVAQQYAGAPLERLYPLVRQKVAEVFPEQFASKETPQGDKKMTLANPNPNPDKSTKAKAVGPASPVERGTKSGATPVFTKADLTSEQQTIMNQFVKSGIMTEEQYIKDISKLQEA